MSPQGPPDPAPIAEVKEEETAVDASNATPTAIVLDSASAPPDNMAEDTLNVADPSVGLSKQDYESMSKVTTYLSDYRDENGHDAAGAFQRLVSKRSLPDYFEIIKEPIALSTVRGKIAKKLYKGWTEYVHDIARMCHNAQVYNRPSAQVYRDAITVRELFKTQMQILVEDSSLTAEEAELEDFGDLPPAEDSPPPGPDDEEVEEDEDDEEDEEEDDETDDDHPRRSRKKHHRASGSSKRDGRTDEGSKDDPESQKKRGRPPKVHTPMEARINTLLKGLRKYKNPRGELKILPFEKLPDKSVMPEYYHEVKNPIAMDLIKRKAKRKKYQSVDQALKDLELMFENAKAYNLEDSEVYKDAMDLQREARILAEQEKKKPDSDFVDEDGRLPLPEILFGGELWKVGDWVHLTNNNDITKPIVAQIYRTWQDPEGQKWINACWYYRPEQTVHRYEKHFFENEVVKTGQYRDHKIEEVVDRCFVMFFTRFNKGRPRGFPKDKEVYVCEARYNEEKFKLNKIKTWASCVPDEVREKDYEMDLFDAPKKMKKVPSPIKHLLREDAKEDDSLPKPTWGVANAPPIVGAVHRRPREANESPPPEPTPSPPPPSPEPVRRPTTSDRPRYDSQGDVSMSGASATQPIPSPIANHTSVPPAYGQQFTPARLSASPAPLAHQNSYSSHGPSAHTAAQPSPVYQSQSSFNQHITSTPVAQHSNPLANYNSYQNSNAAPRPLVHQGNAVTHTNAYNPPRPSEVYTLADIANASIPADIREQFHRDEFGRVVFFTKPPLDANPLPEDKRKLSHSLCYLADKARHKDSDRKRRKTLQDISESGTVKRVNSTTDSDEGKKVWLIESKLKAIEDWSKEMNEGTDELYKQLHGANWKEMRDAHLSSLVLHQQEASKRHKGIDTFQQERSGSKDARIVGFKWI